MFSRVRGVGGFPVMAMALALGIWGLSGRSALAQGDGLGGGAGPGVGGGQPGGGIGGMGTMGPLGTTGVPIGDTGGAGGPGVQGSIPSYGSGGPSYGVSGVHSGAYGAPSGGPSYRGAAYGGYGPGYGGAVPGVDGPGHGTFGLGYPGFGLDYVHGSAMAYHHRHYPRGLDDGNWCTYVLGKECLYPYVADPYGDPAALGFWPPYSAPVARPTSVADRGKDLGIEEEPVVDARGARGMKVAKVYPGTAAAKAGIQAGDVLHSINGYSTQHQGNLAWILAHAAPNHVLEIHLRSVIDGREHTLTARIH
jgi:hypothetical protein